MNARVREPNGFELPNGARERDFKTATSKARFFVHPIPEFRLEPGELLMMTLRSHDQYNTTIYGLDDRYRGIRGGRRVVLMHPDDLAAQGLTARQRVDLSSAFDGETRWARGFETVPYAIPRGCCATYFPEANPLVPIRSVADRSHTPTSKSVAIRVHRLDASHDARPSD